MTLWEFQRINSCSSIHPVIHNFRVSIKILIEKINKSADNINVNINVYSSIIRAIISANRFAAVFDSRMHGKGNVRCPIYVSDITPLSRRSR